MSAVNTSEQWNNYAGTAGRQCDGSAFGFAPVFPHIVKYLRIDKTGFRLDQPLSYYKRTGLRLPIHDYQKVVTELRRPVGTTFTPCCPPIPPNIPQGARDGYFEGSESDVSYLEDYDYLRTRATNAALSRMRDQRADLLANVGERRQVKNMLLSTTSKFICAAKSIKRGSIRGATRCLGAGHPEKQITGKDLAGTWLALQYGWKPLLSDLYNTFEALHPIDTKTAKSVRATVKAYDSGYCPGCPSYGSQGTRTLELLSHGSARCVLNFNVADGAVLTANQLGLTNPLAVAWELVPFSFVVDWFLPVGEYLDSLSNLGLNYIDGSVTVKSKSVFKLVRIFRSPDCAYPAGRYEWGSTVFKLKRTALPTLPGYVLRPKSPFSSMHTANALALLRQAFSGFHDRTYRSR